MKLFAAILLSLCTIALTLCISFFCTAGLVWLGCWALGLLGVAVTFSWSIAIGVWVLLLVVRMLIGKPVVSVKYHE